MHRQAPWAFAALLLWATALTIAPAAAQAPSLTGSQMREDLAFLRDTWAPLEKSFSADQRRAFESVVAATSAATDKLTPAQFELAVSRTVAVSRNGHTQSSFGRFGHFLPVRMWWFADGLYIVRTHPEFSELLGARVEAIGQFTPEQALARVAPFVSGIDAFIKVKSPMYLGCLELLHEVGATESIEHAQLRVRLRNGTQRIVSLGAQPADDPDPSRGLYNQLIPSDLNLPGRWPQVLDSIDRRPSIYERPTDLAYEWRGTDPGVLYLRSNRIFGTNQNRYGLMEKLVTLLQDEVAPRHPKFVIVDLRLNQGGDFFNTIAFAQALPKLLPREGKVFVLIGPGTFSAALVTAAMLKQYGGDQAVLVGEPMGDRGVFWSEGRPIGLPHSGISVTPAQWMWDWDKGCQDPARCYWADTVFGSGNVSLKPQINVVTTFADYSIGRDAVLETILERTK